MCADVICSINSNDNRSMPETVEAIAQAILGTPAPVLLPDTSSLLNIVEVVNAAEKVSPNIVPAALSILARLQSTPRFLHIAVAQVVEKEWLDKHANKQKQAAASLRRADEQTSYLWTIASAMGSAPAVYTQFSGLQLSQRLHDLAENMMRLGMVIEDNDDSQYAAWRRSLGGDAPARPGNRAENDCLLVEQYLELCRRLRSAGFKQRCIFVTSNTRDFGEPKAPRPPLDLEFANTGIDFVYDFAAAAALL
jgi:hypothetical protein